MLLKTNILKGNPFFMIYFLGEKLGVKTGKAMETGGQCFKRPSQ